MEQFSFFTWLPYYILGLVGIFVHILSKLDKGQGLIDWIKNNTKDFWISILSYNVLIFFWVDTGFEFIGLVKNTPSGQAFLMGYFGNSVLNNIITRFEKRLTLADEQQIDPKQL